MNERVLSWMRASKNKFVLGGFRGLLGAAWPALLAVCWDRGSSRSSCDLEMAPVIG